MHGRDQLPSKPEQNLNLLHADSSYPVQGGPSQFRLGGLGSRIVKNCCIANTVGTSRTSMGEHGLPARPGHVLAQHAPWDGPLQHSRASRRERRLGRISECRHDVEDSRALFLQRWFAIVGDAVSEYVYLEFLRTRKRDTERLILSKALDCETMVRPIVLC